MAAFHAGLPESCSVSTVNRQCSSSLQAVWTISNQIAQGDIDIGIAAGVESMSQHWNAKPLDHPVSEDVQKNFSEPLVYMHYIDLRAHCIADARDCLIPMGITNENVVEQFKISRERQDDFAAKSFQKAEAAQKAGRFDKEIVPVKIAGQVVSRDDGLRYGVTAASLSLVKPAFKADGTTHAGNASQLTDGAAAVLLARRSVAEKLGLPIIGKVIKIVTAGVPPRIMGIGPAVAIPKLLAKVSLKISDVDIFEVRRFPLTLVRALTSLQRKYRSMRLLPDKRSTAVTN